MVISGKIRGNAPQLAEYLLTIGENDEIMILDVNGRPNADADYLRQILYSMELNSELTKTQNSVYHGYMNPDPDSQKDRAMSMDEWRQSVEILTKHTPFQEQRQVTVLHKKGGRFHAHIVYERYDHEHGIMVDFKHNYKAQDRARYEIEKTLGHKHTPQKNANQPEHKKILTALWNEAKTGEQFLKRAMKKGFLIAKGTDRPFRVVDSNGRSFDLVRQLDNVKTNEVRERLKPLNLMEDKKAIAQMSLQKKQKENNKDIISKTITPQKNNDMNWNNLVYGNDASIEEIRAKHEGKLELLNEFRQQAQDDLKGQARREKLEQIDELIVKAEKACESDTGQEMNSMFSYHQFYGMQPQNQRDITKALETIPDIKVLIKEQGNEISGDERQQQIEKLKKEITDAKLRNPQIERGFD